LLISQQTRHSVADTAGIVHRDTKPVNVRVCSGILLTMYVVSDRPVSEDDRRWRVFGSIWSGIAGYLRDIENGFVLRAQDFRKGYCERRPAGVTCYCGRH
jgi:hypothetical protein